MLKLSLCLRTFWFNEVKPRKWSKETTLKNRCVLTLLAQQLMWRFLLKNSVNNFFSNQFWLSGLVAAWSHLMIYFGCFLCFKSSLQQLQLFRRMLQCCFAVKLQKCLVDYETCGLTLHQHAGEEIIYHHFSGGIILNASDLWEKLICESQLMLWDWKQSIFDWCHYCFVQVWNSIISLRNTVWIMFYYTVIHTYTTLDQMRWHENTEKSIQGGTREIIRLTAWTELHSRRVSKYLSALFSSSLSFASACNTKHRL